MIYLWIALALVVWFAPLGIYLASRPRPTKVYHPQRHHYDDVH